MSQLIEKSEITVLHFIVQQVRICLDIYYIKKLLPLTQVEQVPGGAPYLSGLLNLLEKSLPVFDLGMRLGMTRESPYTINTPIIICGVDNQTTGIIVDKIIGLALIGKNNFQMNHEFNKPDSPFQAVVTINDELSLLLNQNYILNINMTSGLIKDDISDINMVPYRL